MKGECSDPHDFAARLNDYYLERVGKGGLADDRAKARQEDQVACEAP